MCRVMGKIQKAGVDPSTSREKGSKMMVSDHLGTYETVETGDGEWVKSASPDAGFHAELSKEKEEESRKSPKVSHLGG